MLVLEKRTAIIKDFVSKVTKEDFLQWLALDEAREKREFIRDELSKIASVVNVTLSYVYDEPYSQHIIHVFPKSMYYNSDEYAMLEFDLTSKFITKYPYADINFITEGHDFKLPEFEFTIDSLKINLSENQ